jgi:hypothetical protein
MHATTSNLSQRKKKIDERYHSLGKQIICVNHREPAKKLILLQKYNREKASIISKRKERKSY